jgi:hypothetical protein
MFKDRSKMILFLISLYIIKMIVFFFIGKKILKKWREREYKKSVYPIPAVEELLP